MGYQKKVAVIGAGNWGTVMANTFADAGVLVTLWAKEEEVVRGINEAHENPMYLKGHKLLSVLTASGNLATTLEQSQIVVCSVPTQHIRDVFLPHAERLKGKTIVNASKGIEQNTGACISEIFQDISPDSSYAVLSGPSFALEVAQRLPTAVTVACLEKARAVEIQQLISTPYFRAYASTDVIGVEIGGALKNVIAIACGMAASLRLGHNSQAALINRGIGEMVRLGKTKGAKPVTFLGLSGMGDLVLTCTGPLSRNRRFGMAFGQGMKIAEIQESLEGVAEGFHTAKSAYELGKKLGVEMPITEQVYKILYEGSTPQEALKELMNRELKMEWD